MPVIIEFSRCIDTYSSAKIESQMTKSQMILAEYSIQRGNHIQNKDNLKRKIDKLFM